jgi:hypothetical protein
MAMVKTENLEGPLRTRALQTDLSDDDTRSGENPPSGQAVRSEGLGVEEMAFTRQSDLHAYAKGLTVPPEAIEKWISAGLLFPDEIRQAEKIIKILREKIKVS